MTLINLKHKQNIPISMISLSIPIDLIIIDLILLLSLCLYPFNFKLVEQVQF